MARHRNVRGYNYDEDFEDDDVYGQSVEDDYCISPSTAAQFIYSRRDNSSAVEPGQEYDYGDLKDSSSSLSSHQLSAVDQARLYSCLDYMREILGEAVPDEVLVEAVLQNKFDVQKAMTVVLEPDKMQNLKVKSEGARSTGMIAKGVLFSSSEVSTADAQSCCPLPTNNLDCTSTPFLAPDPVAKYGLCHNSPIVPSHYLLHKQKKLDRPKSEKKLESCKLTEELSLADFISGLPRDSFYESCRSEPLVMSSSSTCSLEGLLSKGPDDDVVRLDRPECLPKDDTEFKGVPDLRSLMLKSTPTKSLVTQNPSLPHFQNIPLQNSALKTMTLGNLNDCTKTEVGSVSFLEQSTQNSILKKGNLPFSQGESPALAELCQEHEGSHLTPSCAPSVLRSPPSATFTDLTLRSCPLSQLANRPQSSTGISELAGSLSSLAFCKASPDTRDLGNLSLSDLIAEAIDVDQSQIEKDSCNLSEMRCSGIDSNIDLSVLIKTPDLVIKPVLDLPVAPTPGTKILNSKLGKDFSSVKDKKKTSKGSVARKPPFSFSWTKALAARPSAFASTLCFQYAPKSCRQRTLHLYKTFLYSRQVQDVKDKEKSPLVTITPFDFKSASPDDIVKANQKKAFTRE
ncbi:HBS1-like protein isoform X4 [Tenrec ecaudatus]|uniref:HBS1-like protein isoform X4 n=1 Tax=Tenrec ecaudatus TaxID=94439 RepID=UPI003F5A7B3F